MRTRLEHTTNNTADLELFARISSGDEQAFVILFKQYAPKLQPLIQKIVRSEIHVKDIIQELFLSLWLSRDQLPQINEPRNWIYKIAYNLSYQQIRKDIRLRHMEEKTVQDVMEAVPQPEKKFMLKEVSYHIQQAIDTLPLQSRNIYKLHREQGLKMTEIARLQNINLQSVKNSLHRSSLQIRSYLIKKGLELPFSILLIILLTP